MTEILTPTYAVTSYNAFHRNLWDGLVLAHSQGWWWHTRAWIEYELARGDHADRSFLLWRGHEPVALCPLLQRGDRFCMEGAGRVWPLVKEDGEPQRPVYEAVLAEVARLAHEHGARSAAFQYLYTYPTLHPRPTAPQLKAFYAADYKHTLARSRLIDLRQPEERLRANLRKSTRHLVNRGARERCYTTHSLLVDLIPPYRRMHAEVSGRETRPAATWRQQGEWARSHGHLLVGALDTATQRWVGFSHGIGYKDRMYYGFDVTNTDDVAHGLLWRLIQGARLKGYTWFETGWMGLETSQKEEQIAFFKRGFGGDDFPMSVVERGF